VTNSDLNSNRLQKLISTRPKMNLQHQIKLYVGMWRYHANRMDARRSQFDLGRVDAYI